MSVSVRLQLLGPVRASTPDGQVALRGKTARTVLARLALSAGSVVSIDQLANALWDDEPPLEPAISVRSIISRLRTQLGRDTIVTDGAGYRLDTTQVEVDLAEIEAGMKNCDLRDTDPDELATRLDMWDGDALADVAWTPAFEPERVRIGELRARLLDSYHEAMLRDGRAETVLADLERDAAASPLRESTQLLLMRALGACGRTADALRSGDDYRQRLIDQTGLNPTADYDAVVRELLAVNDDTAASSSAHDPTVMGRTVPPRTWVPPDTPFVGREAELVHLGQLVQDRRLVTITGPGGVGKTRLVTEFMSERGDRWKGAVSMVGLAALDRTAAVDTAVATALGLEVSSADAHRALVDRLSAQASVLVIDNCEHVLSSTRFLVEHLLRDVEDLRIVTTSRRRLGLPDEAILDVGPLEVPTENATDSSPVRLFLDRVERAAPGLTVSEAEVRVATDICRLVDGLPLALELAAARVAMFGFGGLRRRLVDGLEVPTAQVAEDNRRQATIESTVEWSLALLGSNARHLFDDLSIFPSWFDLAGLEQVSNVNDAVGAFSEIIDSSLVVVDHSRPAYRLLEPVRQVARRQIDDERRGHTIDRYLEWVSSVVDAVDNHWGVSDNRFAAQQLIIDHREDLQWSLNHFIENGDANSHGQYAYKLARVLVDRADTQIIDLCRVDLGPSLEGELARCMLAWHQGDPESSARLADDICPRVGPSSPHWGYCQWARATAYLYLGNTGAVVESASLAAADERLCSSMRSEAVGIWALGLLYGGRQKEAADVLGDNEHILRRSSSGGFVAYSRAEVVAVVDPELALEYLSTASRQAAAAKATFAQRLTDVSQLVLLIGAEHLQDAAQLALRLVPELIRAGTYPQAWTAMRHIADLLGQLDAPELALLVLDSAETAASAPAVVGEAIEAEQRLRSRLEDHANGASSQTSEPLTLGPLWDLVEAVLRQQDLGNTRPPHTEDTGQLPSK